MGIRLPKPVPVVAASAAVALTATAFVTSYVSRPQPSRLLAAQAAGKANTALGVSAAIVAVATRSPRLAATGMLCAAMWAGRAAGGVRRTRHAANRGGRCDLVVVSANTLWENDRHDDVAVTLAGCGADVIISVESTVAQRAALTAALQHERDGWVLATDIDEWRKIQPAIWVRNRMLLTSSHVRLDAGLTMPVVSLDVAGRRVLVGAIHTQSPTSAPRQFAWRRQMAALARHLHGRRTPIILAGDFNASLQHAPMRPLLATMTDASQASGMRWCPTWPSGRSESTTVTVPLLDLDHVLVSDGIGVVAFDTFAVPGADHLAVRAALSLPD